MKVNRGSEGHWRGGGTWGKGQFPELKGLSVGPGFSANSTNSPAVDSESLAVCEMQPQGPGSWTEKFKQLVAHSKGKLSCPTGRVIRLGKVKGP